MSFGGIHPDTADYKEKLRRIRHELGNRHILALSYVENRRYEELGKLCRSGIEELGAALPVINTGNIGIDSIVSFKLRQAAKQNTGVEREIRLAGKVLIGDADLNSLLGNLFGQCAGKPVPGFRQTNERSALN